MARISYDEPKLSTSTDGMKVVSFSSSTSSFVKSQQHGILSISRLCSVVHHRKMSRFFRYLKQLPTYGYVIVLINDLSPIVACQLISRLDTYRQVKVILLTSLSDSFSASHLQPTNRTIRVFHDYSVMFDHLQQIVNQATEEFDNGDSFIIYNRAEKALRDLREHLGSFLWTNTFRRRQSKNDRLILLHRFSFSGFVGNTVRFARSQNGYVECLQRIFS